MVYFSKLIGREVVDCDGKPLGKVHDIGVDIRRKLPPSRSLTIISTKRGKRSLITIPWKDVAGLSGKNRVMLARSGEDLREAGESSADLFLGKHLLDRQIVDLNGRKVVRVNDLCLAEFDSSLALTGVDISGAAILRRLGLGRPMERLLDLLGFDMREKTIAWDYVAPIEIQPEGIKLRIAQTQLRSLHPSDIADILEQLDPGTRSRAIDLMDNLTAAESISEVESFRQADIMSELSEVRASDILEAMPPDEATDVLGLLPREKAERLLSIMGVREASVFRELLGYEEHSAGGRMTPEYIAVTSGYDAQGCIELLRKRAPSAETIYYIYILDNEERLKGVASLRDLLTQEPASPVEQFMEMDVISVNVSDDQEVVADLMNKYDFLALPVVDDDNHLKGIITVDDMIDVLREESREDISQITGLAEVEEGTLGSLRMRAPVFLLTLAGGVTVALALLAFRGTLYHHHAGHLLPAHPAAGHLRHRHPQPGHHPRRRGGQGGGAAGIPAADPEGTAHHLLPRGHPGLGQLPGRAVVGRRLLVRAGGVPLPPGVPGALRHGHLAAGVMARPPEDPPADVFPDPPHRVRCHLPLPAGLPGAGQPHPPGVNPSG